MSASPHESTPIYQRRRPELTSLYRAVAHHHPKLNDRLAHKSKTLPRFVHESFQHFLSSGQFKGGFARLYCHQCKHDRLVLLLDVFIDTLRYHYQRRCLPLAPYPPERYDIDDLNAYYSPRYPHDLGAITSVQRHTDALTLYPHFHVITTDGLLVASDGPLKPRVPVAEAHFLPASYLESEDLIDILILYEHRLTRRFIRRGYLRPITPGLPASEQSFTLHWGHEAPSEE